MPDNTTTLRTETAPAESASADQSMGDSPTPRVPRKKSVANKPVVAVSPRKKPSSGRPKVRRPFPQNTLEDALAVAQAIKEKNNGNPLEPEKVAKACNGLSYKAVK